MLQNNDDLTGKILGSCTLQRLIGRGGMSAVYLAQQVRPWRQVAVKILLPNVPVGSQLHQKFLARFQHEADIIARLEHVNIIPIYEYDEQDGHAYLVMPYSTGGSLNNVLVRYGSLSLAEAMAYIEQAAAALDYAHAQGVIHRDLKPGNFLLHTDGRLMLADFGIARIIQEHDRMNGLTLTSPGVLLGTPNYMAPEMANGEPIDQRTDIYELGIVLFQMLSGEVPFQGTPYSVLIQHLEKPLPLLHGINPVIPPAVDDVIQKATAKKREDRFTSVGEMARALQTAITRPHYTFADSLPYSPSAPTVPIEPPRPNYEPSPALAKGTQADKTIQASFARNDAYYEQQQKPLTPITKSRGFTKTWTMFVGICLVAITALILSRVYIVNAQPGGKSRVSQMSIPVLEAQAKAAVQEFYNDLDQWKYTAAYKLEGGDYCGFVQGYAHTMYDKAALGTVTPVGDNTYSVATTLTATELLSKETVVSTYQGTQLVKKESDGTWKIVHGGNLPLISRVTTSSVTPLAAPGALPTQQAQAVIQQFYAYINQGNYVGAYNLWESANQDSPPFCNFLNGYADTRHVDITFTSLTPQADGTVVVAFTTYATNDNSPTTQVKTTSNVVEYDRYGMWKIKS